MKKRITMFLSAAMATFDTCADTETIGDYTWTQRINGGVLENMV